MPDYRVSWSIDIEAESPLEAAKQAFEYMQDHDTTATVFEVYSHADNAKKEVKVDLRAPFSYVYGEQIRCSVCGFSERNVDEVLRGFIPPDDPQYICCFGVKLD